MTVRQKAFILFALFFISAIIVSLTLSGDGRSPDVSEVSLPRIEIVSRENSDAVSESGESSYDMSQMLPEESRTESDISAESDEPSDDSVGEISDEPSEESFGESSEELSEEPSLPPTPASELPYDPSRLMELMPDDLAASDLDGVFNDSVFIGNSLTVHFYNYVCARRLKNPGFLGSEKFFCTYGYSAYNDLNGGDDKLPKYKGEALHTWQAVRAMKAKTVYIDLMGLTEIWKYPYSKSPEKTFESHAAMIERIRSENPGVRIVLLSSSYMVKSFNSKARALNNYLLSRFNAIALDWCNKNGCDFIDVSTPFLDGNAIRDEYCRDPGEKGQGCHIKNEYYSAWIGVLRNYAYQKRKSTWRNPTEMRIIPAE